MRKIVKNMIVKALDVLPNPEIYIKDSYGNKVIIYDYEDLNDWAFNPPFTVNVFSRIENKWELFEVSSLSGVFSEQIGNIIEQNFRIN